MRSAKETVGARARACALLVLVLSSCGESPRSALREYRFDSEDRLEAVVTQDGNRIRYRWNAAGYLEDVRYRGGRIRYGYDPAGLLAWTDDRRGSVEYYRDALGRVTDVLWRGAFTRVLRYEYDSAHRAVGVEVYNLDRARRDGGISAATAIPDGLPDDEDSWRAKRAAVLAASDSLTKAGTFTEYRVRYELDDEARVRAVDGPGGRVAVSHAPSGRSVERRWPNGASTIENFDADGRTLGVEHRDAAGTTLAAFVYSWSDRGELRSATEQVQGVHRAATFHWERDRMIRVEPSGGHPIDLAYDDTGQLARVTGNSTSVEYAYDEIGRLTRSGPAVWGLNVNGWPESLTVNGHALGIEYDGRGLPTEIQDGRTDTSIAFDPLGHLSSVRTGGDERHFLADPLTAVDAPLVSWDQTGRVVGSRVYGNELLLQTDASGRTTYLLRDGLGTVRLALGESGAVRPVGASPWDSLHGASMVAVRYASRPSPARRARWPFPQWTATLHAAQREDETSDLWRLRDLDVAAMWSRFLAEEQYFREAGFDSSRVAGLLYDHRIRNRFDRFLNATRSRSVTVYLRGISNGWAETTADTRFRCPDGDCVFLPTFGALPNWMHLPATFVEKALIGLTPRKLDMPALIERARAAGKTIAIVCESGCGFELQRNVPALERYARANPGVTLPLIVVQSTDIGPTLRGRLERAGYAVSVVSEDKIVPRVVASAADYAGIFGRIPVVGERVGLPIQLASAVAFAGGELLSGRSVIGPHGIDDHWLGIQPVVESHRFPVKALRDVTPEDLERLWPADHGSADTPGGVSPADEETTLPGLERRLGGIALAVRGESEIDAGSVAGLAYDPATGVAYLLGRRQVGLPPLRIADLAVATSLAYRDPPVYPTFSLDPADSRDPHGPWLKLVYRPESLRGTESGHTMFLADWLMKQLSFGLSVDFAGAVRRRQAMPAGLRDIFSLTFDQARGGSSDEVWTRLWLVAKEFRWKAANDAVLFTSAQMGVRAKRQVVDSRSETGLRDVDDAVDPASARFAADLTSSYDDVAETVTEFARLTELAKLVALARWLRDAGVPVDADWLQQRSRPGVEAIARVSALSDTREQRSETTSRNGTGVTVTTAIRKVSVFGGVDLTVTPAPDGSAGTLGRLVAQTADAAGPGRQFEVSGDNGVLLATALPVNEQGRSLWRTSRPSGTGGVTSEYGEDGTLRLVTNGDGTTLEMRAGSGRATAAVERRNGRAIATHSLNAAGKIDRSNHASGVLEYRYGADGRLAGVSHDGVGGLRSTWTSTADGSAWTVAAPGYEPVEYRYDRNGLFLELSIEGQRSARYPRAVRQSPPPGLVVDPPADPASSVGAAVPGGRRPRPAVTTVRTRLVTWVGRLFGTSGLRFETVPYPTATSTDPSDPADRLRFDEVRRLSTADAVLVYVGRPAARPDDLVQLQFGQRQLMLRQGDLDIFLENGEPPSALHEVLREQAEMSRLMVLTPADGSDSAEAIAGRQLQAVRLVEALNAAWGHEVSVHLATDAAAGLQNTARLPLVLGPQDVSALVPPDSFQITDYGLMDRIRMYLQKFGLGVADGPRVIEHGNVLVISGHKDFQLTEYLTALGERQALRGKYVLLFSCNDPGDVLLNSRLTREFGAVGVHFFAGVINLQAVTDVIRALARKVAEPRRQGQTLERLIREAVDAAVGGTRARRLQEEIRKLRRGITQVSELHGSRPIMQPA